MSADVDTPGPARTALERLARARGVEVSYVDVAGRRQVSSDATLVAVLAALGEPLAAPEDAPGLVTARGASRRRHPRDHRVVVAWDGRLPPLGSGHDRGSGTAGPLELTEEGGSPRRLETVAGPRGAVRCEETLPFGVHRLHHDDGRLTWVLSAPRRPDEAPRPEPGAALARSEPPEVPSRRAWGVFAPAYGLLDERDRLAGDLTALGALGEIVAPGGAEVVATLPLLAELTSAEEPGAGRQPYAPLSRMFWNEAYLDLAALPELADEEGGRLVASALASAGPPALSSPPAPRRLADLSRVALAARPALERAAALLEAEADSPRRRAFEAFRAARPDLERYARFRAAVEARGPDRSRWPRSWQGAGPDTAHLPEGALRRHRYAQFATHEQLAALAGRLSSRGCGLLLDLPIGCRRDGYDPWANPGAFATGASVGAPPDDFFRGGQDWGFPPPLPEGDRREGYPMLRAVLAHNAAHARLLRIDHVLGFSRLWWVPAGMPAAEGAYVRSPTDELLAVACLEAWRHDCGLIGEDLGTVPRGLRPRLRRHGIAGMRVAVFDLAQHPGRPLRPPAGTVAGLDTHDTATFAAFLSGADVDLRQRLGLVSTHAAASERDARRRVVGRLRARLVRQGRLTRATAGDDRQVLGALLEELGRSEADLVVVALEDLLGELEPQNVPGTTSEHDNFSRTLAARLEAIARDPAVADLLGRLEAARRPRAGTAPGGREA